MAARLFHFRPHNLCTPTSGMWKSQNSLNSVAAGLRLFSSTGRGLQSKTRAGPLACAGLLRTIHCSTIRAQQNPSRSFFTSNRLVTKPLNPAFFFSRRNLGSTSSTLASLSATAPAPTASPTANALPALSPPAVSRWLFACSALVFGIIVVGGVTRLTESGLSITEWKPVTGTLPPLTAAQWEQEFEKYKATPEFKLLNHQITLSEFKGIFYMEYAHRLLGRVIGLTYVIPFLYFLSSKKITQKLPAKLTGLALLLGFQGFLGWYMVKSGLEDSLMDTPGAVPRVSQYRLAAHLGAALVLYAGMLGTGLAVMNDWKWANLGLGSGEKQLATKIVSHAAALEKFLSTTVGKRFRAASWGLLGLVFVTALSGAFVAGLDAGLLYNEFPLMGGRLVPPSEDLFAPAYAKKADKSDLWWRNILENPTTVQFDHRCLAMTTYFSSLALFLSTKFNPTLKAALPSLTKKMVTGIFHAANLQVLLGISTLIYLVPVPLAATHQAGSVVLISTVVALLSSLRRPGRVAQIWRSARMSGSSSSSSLNRG